MSELTLGQKLKFFRKEKGMSQSELEVETGLSFGTVSRIENGQINPTKESIIKIASKLELTEKDLTYLLELRNSKPNNIEVENIVAQFQQELDQEVFPAYIMDNRFRIWAYNKSILELFGISDIEAKKGLGSNVIEVTFLTFKIFNKIPKKYLLTVLKDQLAIFKQEAGRYSQEEYSINLFKDLKKNPLFNSIWSKKLETKQSFRIARYYLNYHGKTLKILISRSAIPIDERFFFVEYFPQDKETAGVFEKIREEIKPK